MFSNILLQHIFFYKLQVSPTHMFICRSGKTKENFFHFSSFTFSSTHDWNEEKH